MEFRLLGPLEVVGDDGTVELGARKQRQLLALLLVNANQVVSTDRLIDELWGEQAPGTAHNALQVYVSKLRKALPSGTLVTRPPGYVLQVDPDSLDIRRFERLVHAGRGALRAGDVRRARSLLENALGLWRGPALAEFAFDAFAAPEITRLDELRLGALEERIEADLALGAHDEVVGELEGLVAAQPLRERLRGQLMLALYRSGRQAEALSAYRNAREALVDQLGIDPSADLQRLEHAILVQDPALDVRLAPAGRTPATVLFADLGIAEADDDPQRAEEAVSHAVTASEDEGGRVQRGIANAVLVVFDADDHADRAVAAALTIADRVTEDFGHHGGPRMALESGEVTVDDAGHASGAPVTAVARLVRSAAPGEIVVGPRAAAEQRRAVSSPRLRSAT
jgi:DNA-binding SARP family transcriptional activator